MTQGTARLIGDAARHIVCSNAGGGRFRRGGSEKDIIPHEPEGVLSQTREHESALIEDAIASS